MFIINVCLNMFLASLYPSSGEQRPCYCIWCVLVLLDVVGSGCAVNKYYYYYYYVPGGIQTRYPSKRATADPGLKPRDHRNHVVSDKL